MLMDFTFMDKTPTHLDKIPVKAKINTLISLNLAASEPQNFFCPLLSGPFLSLENRPTLREDSYCDSCGSHCEKHKFQVNVTDTCKRLHPQHILRLEY